MLVRLGFVVLVTFAAFTLKRGKGPPNKDNGQAKKKEKTREEKEGEEEEVKTINGIINSAPSMDDDEDEMFSDIESFLGGEINIRYWATGSTLRSGPRTKRTANNAAEMERLRGLVRELKGGSKSQC